MNPDGHLIDRSKLDDHELRRRGLDPGAYRQVPESHADAAERKLAGGAEAHVSRTSGGKLSKLAVDFRREQRLTEKTRRKQERKDQQAAKAALRQNRRPR
jgi:hypothetical protein